MLVMQIIDVTSQLSPVFTGMLALLGAAGLGILFCAWSPRFGGVSFSRGIELSSSELLQTIE